MTWTAPRTWAFGNDVDAADLNEQIRDNLNELRSTPWCRSYLATTAQSLTKNATTVINLNAESFDSPGWHSTTSNTSRITPDKPGLYMIHGQALIDFVNTNTTHYGVGVLLLKNGAELAGFGRGLYFSRLYDSCLTSCAIAPANGTSDHFELAVFRDNDSLGANDIKAGAGEFLTWLSVTFLGA